jgi:hypothetical protein
VHVQYACVCAALVCVLMCMCCAGASCVCAALVCVLICMCCAGVCDVLMPGHNGAARHNRVEWNSSQDPHTRVREREKERRERERERESLSGTVFHNGGSRVSRGDGLQWPIRTSVACAHTYMTLRCTRHTGGRRISGILTRPTLTESRTSLNKRVFTRERARERERDREVLLTIQK